MDPFGGDILEEFQYTTHRKPKPESINRLNMDPVMKQLNHNINTNKTAWINTSFANTTIPKISKDNTFDNANVLNVNNNTNKKQINKINTSSTHQYTSHIHQNNINNPDKKDIISPFITTLSMADKVKDEKQFKIHIAIDFGTDGCALASSFPFTGNVEVYDRWRSTLYPRSVKTKTQILLNRDNQVVSFGDEAKNMFIGGALYKDEWKLFERFKMALYDDKIDQKDIDISEELTSTNGQRCSSEVVFVAAFKHLHEEAKSYLSKFGEFNIKDHDIQWIITVPAIWNEKAKNKMMQWAIKAGLVDEKIPTQCKIVYEPDCASLAIQHEIYEYIKQNEQEIKEVDENEENSIYKFAPMKGEKYILVDAGGGTVDVACHEILGDLTAGNHGIREIVHPTGGKWGSCYIDDQFVKLLENIFSKKWMKEFKKKEENVYVEIINNFQKAKSTFYNNSENDRHSCYLPYRFLAFLDEKCAKSGNNMKPSDLITNKYPQSMGLIEETKSNNVQNDASWMEQNADYTKLLRDSLQKQKLMYIADIIKEVEDEGLADLMDYSRNNINELLDEIHNDKENNHKIKVSHRNKFAKTIIEIATQKKESQGKNKNDVNKPNINQQGDSNEFYMDINHWKQLFDHVINPIILHVKTLINEHEEKLKNCKYLYLVGGLSCSEYFKCRMKEEFGKESKYKLQVIIPNKPMLSVVRGAAYLGITDNYIRARVMNKSYGQLCSYPQNYAILRGVPHEHMIQKSFYNEFANEVYVDDCFEPFVRTNQEILSTVCFQSTLSRIDPKNEDILYIMCSDQINPKTKSDGTILGELKIPFNENDEEQHKVRIQFHFHDTMLHVYAYSKHGKKEIHIKYV